MRIITLAFKQPARQALSAFILGGIISLIGTTAHGQTSHHFEDINQTSSNDFVLELETEDNDEPVDQDLISVDPIRLFINRKVLADLKPELRDPGLVHAAAFQDGAVIQWGSKLRFEVGYHAPGDIDIKRRVSLFSELDDPEHPLDEDTEWEIGDTEGFALTWREHSGSANKSVATINTHLQQASRPDYATPNQHGDSDYYRHVFLETANLKPGNYQLVLKVYRKDGEDIAEQKFQNFHFTIVDAPINVIAFIPSSITPYNGSKSAHFGNYEVGFSDWAVPPYMAKMEASVPGFSLEFSDSVFAAEVYETLFEIVGRPKPDRAGMTTDFSLTVTDGLGRVATTKRQIKIDDGADSEIRVSLPQSVNAGQSMTGTVIYPAGFTLKKPPRIGDLRGFEWTNSDYTAFRITPDEEGVHHQRLFSIIASGTMSGMVDDPVLVWKREYTVKSQDLIYDEAEIRRREEANRRAWNDALQAFSGGMGEVASAYESASASTDSDLWESHDKAFEIIETQSFDDDPEDAFYEITGSDSGSYEGSSESYESSSSSPSGSRSEDASGQIICGHEVGGEWTISGRSHQTVTRGGQKHPVWHVWKWAQNSKSHDIRYFKADCVKASEDIPYLDYTEHLEYYTNGGKKLEDTNTVLKEWDRPGNLTRHIIKNDGMYGTDRRVVCDNNKQNVRECS